MPHNISPNKDGSITVSFTFRPGSSMLESEFNLQSAANAALCEATGECLTRFDTDGSPLIIGDRKYTSKGSLSKTYQTPYGGVAVSRHVYQSSSGGAIFCPMEKDGRVFRTSTPMFAKQVASKYANADSGVAVKDFAEHGRKITRSFVREIGSDVALVIAEKEETWTYSVAEAPSDKRVAIVSIGIDGTCMLMNKKQGWREVMVGTLALYDENGERIHTTYAAAAPEYGKQVFLERMDAELDAVKKRYPDASYVGVADGAHENWKWLTERTGWQILDFWHATEYVHNASAAMTKGKKEQASWADEACHRLKHDRSGAESLLIEMSLRLEAGVRNKVARESLQKAVTYFTNNKDRMDYWLYQAMGYPLGSGVTEAACKCIAKARMCGSGMRWDTKGADEVLALRSMIKTDGRWDEFWDKVSQYGFTKITASKRPKKEVIENNEDKD
jgi:hypothetical protein